MHPVPHAFSLLELQPWSAFSHTRSLFPSWDCGRDRSTWRAWSPAGAQCGDAVEMVTFSHSAQPPARFQTALPDVLLAEEPSVVIPALGTLLHSSCASSVLFPTAQKCCPCSTARSFCRQRLSLLPLLCPSPHLGFDQSKTVHSSASGHQQEPN